MKLKVSVFEYLNQKVMYIQDVNYYFGIKDDFDIKFGDYELSEEEVLNIAKENDLEEYEVFTNTSIEERLNKINTYNIDDVKEQSSYGQFTLCLHPSRKCNLNCKYCFRESEYLGEQQLTFEVAKDAIDFLVDKYAPCASKYVVDLSGSGEPLLQIDLIKQIVEYCKKKRNEICKNIEVMFCTNLTLLTPEIVEYLDNEPAIILGTSIDGDQITNDNNRVYINGKGTYADIVKGLKMFKNKKLGLAVTITPLNQDVDLIYDHLYHLSNVDCISMSFIRCYDGSKYDFDNFDVNYLIKRYELFCERIFLELENDNLDYLKKLLIGTDVFGSYIIQAIFKSFKKLYKCDAGKNRIVVGDKGNIFGCSVMMGNNDFLIGNVHSGIDAELQNKFYISPILTQYKCIDCLVAPRCGGECYVSSYSKYNDMVTPVSKMCDIKTELIKLSIAFIQKLRSKYKTIYNKLFEFVLEIQNYSITDSSILSIMNWLKLKNYKADLNDVLQNVDCSLHGAIPAQALEYLRLYDKKADSYQIESISEITEVNLPAICLLNKAKANGYHYALLVDINEKYVSFYEGNFTNMCSVPINEFLCNVSNIFLF